MNTQHEHGDIARAIIDANLYMTLGTADEEGQPWVTPVFYATGDYTEFYWVSRIVKSCGSPVLHDHAASS
jgi:nitroimidazol reductase NimA-like FMN-containing flavoprotein (pyridoxamine 5'-phosphate oxidase superfamily)